MAKKENNIPTIIDTPEALTAKIAAIKEAQKIFATFTQDQVDKILKQLLLLQTKPVSRLLKMQLKKQVWAL